MFAPACFGQNGQEYLRTANDNVILIVQMESRKAIDNCEEIAAIDGVGMLSFLVCVTISGTLTSCSQQGANSHHRHAVCWSK